MVSSAAKIVKLKFYWGPHDKYLPIEFIFMSSRQLSVKFLLIKNTEPKVIYSNTYLALSRHSYTARWNSGMDLHFCITSLELS